MQFAGSVLGGIWLVLQGSVLIGLYIFIAGGIGLIRTNSTPDYIPYILSGLLFWIPIAEMIQRSTTILTDNRSLIKRSGLGADLFLWIPVIQMFFHFTILSIPVMGYLFWMGKPGLTSLLILPWIGITALVFFPFLIYLSRSNVLLKDISPVVRLFLQLGFWSLPLVYIQPAHWLDIIQYHPLFFFLEVFRFLLFPDSPVHTPYYIPLFFTLGMGLFYKLLNLRFKEIILDHL